MSGPNKSPERSILYSLLTLVCGVIGVLISYSAGIDWRIIACFALWFLVGMLSEALADL